MATKRKRATRKTTARKTSRRTPPRKANGQFKKR